MEYFALLAFFLQGKSEKNSLIFTSLKTTVDQYFPLKKYRVK